MSAYRGPVPHRVWKVMGLTVAELVTPLEASYARLGAVSDELRIHLGVPCGDEEPAEAGWVVGQQLARDEVRLRWLVDAELAHARHRLALNPRRDVAATWVFQHYLWAAAVLVSWPMALDRRVPRLGVGDVALHMPFDGCIAATVRPTGFDCLPDDPAAGHPDANVVPDLEALRGSARDAARAHFEPLMMAFAPELRRGPWALWGTATDQVVSALWYLGILLDDQPWGAEEAQDVLPGGTPPFVGSAGFRHVDRNGEISPTRMRVSCCLFYTVLPDQVCVTCPRLRESEPGARQQEE